MRTIFSHDLKAGLKQASNILGTNKAMIMTDPDVAALPIRAEMQQAMTDIGFSFETFTFSNRGHFVRTHFQIFLPSRKMCPEAYYMFPQPPLK